VKKISIEQFAVFVQNTKSSFIHFLFVIVTMKAPIAYSQVIKDYEILLFNYLATLQESIRSA